MKTKLNYFAVIAIAFLLQINVGCKNKAKSINEMGNEILGEYKGYEEHPQQGYEGWSHVLILKPNNEYKWAKYREGQEEETKTGKFKLHSEVLRDTIWDLDRVKEIKEMPFDCIIFYEEGANINEPYDRCFYKWVNGNIVYDKLLETGIEWNNHIYRIEVDGSYYKTGCIINTRSGYMSLSKNK